MFVSFTLCNLNREPHGKVSLKLKDIKTFSPASNWGYVAPPSSPSARLLGVSIPQPVSEEISGVSTIFLDNGIQYMVLMDYEELGGYLNAFVTEDV